MKFFFNFIKAERLDSQSVKAKLIEVLFSFGMDTKLAVVAQCYVMSGRFNGFQQLMRQGPCPRAIYIHCWAHRLNLVVLSCVQVVRKAIEFFDIMGDVYHFFNGSVVHDKFLDIQKSIDPLRGVGKALQVRELKAISKTRWCCQGEACQAVIENFRAVIDTIDHFCDETTSGNRRGEATLLLHRLDSDFIFCLVLFKRILRQSNIVSNYLQDDKIDLSKASNIISSLSDSLTSETLFDEIYEEAVGLTTEHDIPAPIERRRRKCRSDAGDIPTSVWEREDFKNKLFVPVINTFTTELERRFSSYNCSILSAVACLFPTSTVFLDLNVLMPFVVHYGIDSDSLIAEMQVFRCQFSKHQESKVYEEKCRTMVDVRRFIEGGYIECYTQLFRVYRIAVTLPVTTAGNERSFSTMKRTKSYLRSTMLDDSLGYLACLSINRERAKEIEMDSIVDTFGKQQRRIELF